MEVHDLFDDGHAEAGARGLRGEERQEDLFPVFGGDAGAVVDDLDDGGVLVGFVAADDSYQALAWFDGVEGVAQEMRKNKDMVFFYEYETPVATSPTGEVLDLIKEFGTLRTSGRGWAIDESWLVGAAVGVAAAGSIAVVRLPSDRKSVV